MSNEGSFAVALDPREQTAALLGCLLEARKCKEQPAHVVVNSIEGMEVQVISRSKSSMSRLKFPSASFINFVVRDESECEENEESIRLSVDAVALVECLQLLGSTLNDERTITLSYKASEAVVKLTLEEFGIFTTCDLAALDMDVDIEIWQEMRTAFRTSGIVAEIICNSKILKELVSDLDDSSATLVRVVLSSNKLSFSVTTTNGTIEIEAPNNLFAKFKVSRTSRTFIYRKENFLRGMAALAYATDTYLIINDDGILKLQHIIAPKANHADHVFLEYYCSSTAGIGALLEEESNHLQTNGIHSSREQQPDTNVRRPRAPSSSSDDEALLPVPKKRYFGVTHSSATTTVSSTSKPADDSVPNHRPIFSYSPVLPTDDSHDNFADDDHQEKSNIQQQQQQGTGRRSSFLSPEY